MKANKIMKFHVKAGRVHIQIFRSDIDSLENIGTKLHTLYVLVFKDICIPFPFREYRLAVNCVGNT